MKLGSFLSTFIVALLLLVNASAQTLPPAETSKEEEQKAKQELEQKALAMLNEILDSVQLLKLPENRSFVLATAADLLWKHDEKRARSYFQSAMNDLTQAIKETTLEDAQGGDSHWFLSSQRERILIRLAQLDPQFALDLLQSSRPAFTENQPLSARMRDQELMLEQAIIAEVAANDPKLALQMAQESLATGVSFRTLSMLQKIQSKDPKAATTFAGDIVKKLGATDLSKSREVSNVAQGLLRILLQPDRAPSNTQTKSSAKKTTALTLDEQTIRDLIDIVVTAALSVTNEGYDIMMLQPLLPEMEKRAPERVAQLRKKLSDNSERFDPELKLVLQYQILIREGKPDALFEAAAKAPSDMRSMLYRAAVTALMQRGDLEGARKVVADHVGGPDGDQLLATLDQQLIARALQQDKMDEARRLIGRITPIEARLAQVANMATGMFAKGDRKMALALLDQTQQLVNRAPENQRELNAMLKVAKAYALIEPLRAFGILEPVIDQANALLAAAAVLEKFGVGTTFFKDNEFRMQMSMDNNGALSFQFRKELASLARTDFTRTRALADRFLRDEARMMARLLVAQAVLAVQPERGNAVYAGDVVGGFE